MIRITEDRAEWAETQEDMLKVVMGTTNTPNGEIKDSSARAIATAYADWQGGTLNALASGKAVQKDALVEAVGLAGRREFWPEPLELLATWVANHDGSPRVADESVYTISDLRAEIQEGHQRLEELSNEFYYLTGNDALEIDAQMLDYLDPSSYRELDVSFSRLERIFQEYKDLRWRVEQLEMEESF